MKKITGLLFAACAMVAGPGAMAGQITDSGATAYWGGNDHDKGDVIGGSLYDIAGATITRVSSVLTITIATNFAGNAGADPWSSPNGIGYGDLFLSSVWNPYGKDAHHEEDNMSNGTKWEYAFGLGDSVGSANNRWNDNGGTFKLYQLNGSKNSDNIKSTSSYMNCTLGTQCLYREGQATGVKTTSSTVKDTGITGTWTVSANKEIKFVINVSSTALVNFTGFAMHWGETCQNDVIEGYAKVVPLPGTLPLLALGLGGLALMRRRRAAA